MTFSRAGGAGGAVIGDVVLAVHGGAGAIGSLTAEQDRAYRDALTRALRAGQEMLQAGGPSLDAVETAVTILEDDPSFNAGKGAVFTCDGGHELDASIMNGKDLTCGAVTGVHNTKNPVSLARMVMERSPHVLLSGRGADIFALRHGVPYTTQDYFFTQRRWDALMAARHDHIPAAGKTADETTGTVGAVALDHHRDLAAATSTGGRTDMLVGRVSDSSVIGAGTYADSRTVAVSCTGTGEVFIRGVAAYDIATLMNYAHLSVQDAAATVITEKLPALGATGGAIALDPHGNLATSYSTATLINGYITRDGHVTTRLYANETPPR